MGLPHTAREVEAGAGDHAVVNAHSGCLGPGGGGSASRGGPGGVSPAYSTLAAAETVPGRALITHYRLLLGGKQT